MVHDDNTEQLPHRRIPSSYRDFEPVDEISVGKVEDILEVIRRFPGLGPMGIYEIVVEEIRRDITLGEVQTVIDAIG